MLRGSWSVQARGGVRRPHALPYDVWGARGVASPAAYSLAHGAWGDSTARNQGSRQSHRCVLIRTAGPAAHSSGGAGVPLCILPGPTRVSRGEAPSAFNSGVMRLHSRQVCLITCRQTWLFQRPSSLTHPLPSGAWWRAALKDRVMMMIRGEATDSYIYISLWEKNPRLQIKCWL